MKRLFFVLALIFAVGTVHAADGDLLADRLFAPEIVPLKLTDLGLTGSGKPSFQVSTNPSAQAGELNPGKALLLSAIIPGAGEFYAGSKIKAAIFFTIEVAAWTSVVYFYGEGKDKEDEFIAFANKHFDEKIYRDHEFGLAQDQRYGDLEDSAYDGTLEEWTALSWEEKIHYLPREGFTHELPTPEERDANWSLKQQFYEMIGKYIHQFGMAWSDQYGDIDGTPHFDGVSDFSQDYMGMRDDSNKLLGYSAWGYNIALLNHVASALDASFSVRIAKRRAKAELGFRQVPYNGGLVNAAGLNFSW
ncbi:hypothetical protein HQ587_06415 [bacterium]|nr:hypothetical protein [bacterium]